MQDTIIFIHRGQSWYLYYTVKQAHDFHPHADIVVISDVEQPDLERYARVLPLEDYWESADRFASIYEHHSTNSYDFELFCFQRWFVVADFISKHRPKRLAHLDSDLLVYDDLFADFTRLQGCDLALVARQGPFSLLLPQPDLVNRFCRRISKLYTEEKAELKAIYTEWTKDGRETAVSDMHALHTFVSGEKLRVIDLAEKYNGTAYDNVVHLSDGYCLENGCKKLRWKKNQPFAQVESSQEWIRLKTLHCQGASKHRILDFFTQRDLSYRRDRILAMGRQKWETIKAKY